MLLKKANSILWIAAVLLFCCIWLAAAWHPEKKVMKWNAEYFRPASYKVCAVRGAPCGVSQKLYSMKWRSQTCCFGLECYAGQHGSYCMETQNSEETELGMDNDTDEQVIPEEISI